MAKKSNWKTKNKMIVLNWEKRSIVIIIRCPGTHQQSYRGPHNNITFEHLNIQQNQFTQQGENKITGVYIKIENKEINTVYSNNYNNDSADDFSEEPPRLEKIAEAQQPKVSLDCDNTHALLKSLSLWEIQDDCSWD
jgi:hypothetical protein